MDDGIKAREGIAFDRVRVPAGDMATSRKAPMHFLGTSCPAGDLMASRGECACQRITNLTGGPGDKNFH